MIWKYFAITVILQTVRDTKHKQYEMRSRKDEMPVFIQAMYGTVVGLSFYHLAIRDAETLSTIRSSQDLIDFLTSVPFFKFLFFSATLLITAQDLAGFHSSSTKRPSAYWHYIPQILALLCLSQMFRAVDIMNIRQWYGFAFGHTLTSLTGFLFLNKKESRTRTAFQYLRYLIQLFIAEIFFFTLTPAFVWHYYLIAIMVTLYVLVFTWWLVSDSRD